MRLLSAARRVTRPGKLLLLGPGGDLAGEIKDSLRMSRSAYSLVVPPGQTILRRLNIPDVGRRKRESALRLAAETAITRSLDDYVVDYWRIDAQSFGLAAIPRDLLSDYQTFADERGQAARGVLVSELTADLKNGLVVWVTERVVMLCLWSGGALVDWQVIPRPNGLVALEQMLQFGVSTDPNEIILRVGLDEDQAFGEAVRDSCERVFSKAQIRVERKPVTERDQSGRVLCAFDDFVGEQSNRPASSARRRGAVDAVDAGTRRRGRIGRRRAGRVDG